MSKSFRVALTGILFWGCVVKIAVTQGGPESGNKLTGTPSATMSDRTNGNTATAVASVSDEFVIGPGDVLAVNVWREPEISKAVPVRSDGRISLPLVGEIQASGRTPKQLQAEVVEKLKDYVSEPEVTVIVQEITSKRFNVLGMVMKPGSYALTNSTTVLDAIAMAGGFRDFAKQRDIYVLRHAADGKEIRLPFNYKSVVKSHNFAQNVSLQANDTVIVP
jgi:polysaccharide export outer membrane protein